MISLSSNYHRPRAVKPNREHAGDGYEPQYNYGTYKFVTYDETDLPVSNPGVGLPWTPVANYPPGLYGNKGMQRSFAFSAAEAIRHPGIVGTDPGQGTDPRTNWGPFYTIQQQAIQTALRQRTAH